MTEAVTSLMFGLVTLAPVAIFVRQVQQVRGGKQGKAKAIALFFSLSLIPLLAYALMFLGLVAIEEVTALAVVSEGLARSFLPVAAIAIVEIVLLTVALAITVVVMRGGRDAIKG